MTSYVIDENVAIVANDNVLPEPKAPQADVECQLACIKALRAAVRQRVVVDSGGIVLENYRKHLLHKGQPGAGDAFFKHLIDNQFNTKRVLRLPLHAEESRGFVEFPGNAGLLKFDRSDRVFVALTLTAAPHSQILNAVDSDYSEFAEPLQEAGVFVVELCPHCLKDVG